MAHDALRGSGYIGQARPQDVTLSFEPVLGDLCQFVLEEMGKTRRALGSMSSEVNAGGEEVLRRRVERTPVERHTTAMYERREEVWRGLTRERVVAFIRLFLLCLVELENGLPLETATYRMLKKALVKRIIPWIHFRLVYTMEERWWPITLGQFRELDQYLAEHLPLVQKDESWDAIRYFYEEVLKQRAEYARMEQMEKEAKEAYDRCMTNLNS